MVLTRMMIAALAGTLVIMTEDMAAELGYLVLLYAVLIYHGYDMGKELMYGELAKAEAEDTDSTRK